MTTTQRHAARRSARPAVEPYRSLLVAVDLSPATERIIERTMLLPLGQEARLVLVHVLPKALPAWMRRAAVQGATQALTELARAMQKRLRGRGRVQSVVSVGEPAREIARQAQKHRAALVVMGRGGGRALRDIFLGSTSERVLRQSQIPVLVVRLPAHDVYRRPLLALDTDLAAAQAVLSAHRILPPARPALALVHVYDLPYGRSVHRRFSQDEERRYRDDCRQQAVHDMAGIVAAALTRIGRSAEEEPVWRMHVRHGSPRRVIRQTVDRMRADLLVLGTHGRTGVAHALLGSVAGDVLRDVPCDVLVVPPEEAERSVES